MLSLNFKKDDGRSETCTQRLRSKPNTLWLGLGYRVSGSGESHGLRAQGVNGTKKTMANSFFSLPSITIGCLWLLRAERENSIALSS